MNVAIPQCVSWALALLAGGATAQGDPAFDAPRSTLVTEVQESRNVAAGELLATLMPGTTRAQAAAAARASGCRNVGWIPALGALRFVVDEGVSLLAARERLRTGSGLRDVGFNGLVTPADVCVPGSVAPDDAHFPDQWHLRNDGVGGTLVGADIGATEAWALSTGSSSVTVAVVDFGFSLEHSQLAARFVGPYDFFGEDDDPSGPNAHGTLVAGMLGAAHDASSVAGVDAACRIMPLKVGDYTTTEFEVAQAIVHAVDHGCRVVNLSLGAMEGSPVENSAIKYATDHGVVLVAAAGNDPFQGILFPAKNKNVIGVGWTDAWDQKAYLSPAGIKLGCVAPGWAVATVAAADDGGFDIVYGSSYATPIVSGIAALVLAVMPEATPEQFRDALYAGCKDQIGSPAQDLPGFDKHYGHGRVDAYRTLSSLLDRGLIDGGLVADQESVDPGLDWQVTLCLDAGVARGGQLHWLFANLSGSGSSTDVGFATIPLAPDALLRFSLDHPNAGMLGDNLGLLDGDGRGSVTLGAPAGVARAASGMELSACFLTLDPHAPGAGPTFVSRVVTVAME